MKVNILKACVLLLLFAPAIHTNAQSKLGKQVLMTIGGDQVTAKEFTDVYEKNNLKSGVVDKKSVDEYLDLFINYKMKVKEATEMKLDTSAKFKRELANYRKQLAKPYFSDEVVSENLLEEAYQRKLKDIRASHILVACDKNALPSDTLKAYKKAMSIRKRVMDGEDFGKVAAEVSDDPSAHDYPATESSPARFGNHGDLGYFTVFDMVYPFETGAYNTKEGEVSMPVRSDFGYHIIKVTSITDAIGTVSAAHIFLQLPLTATEEEETAMRDKANNIYKEIMAQDGKNWNDAVRQYTDDKGTISRGGGLSNFTVSRIVPEFIEAVKTLKPNEISKPIRTSYGYHIIKLLSTTKIGTFEQEKQGIAERVEKDVRSKKSEEVVLSQVKKEYGFKQDDKNLEGFMASVDTTILGGKFTPAANTDLNKPLFSMEKQKYTVNDFVKYIQDNQVPQKYVTSQTYATQLYENFSNQSVMDYADAHLEEKYPDFKQLVNEYYDGIMLFDLMDKEVWSKAVKDTTGLENYYESHKTNYMWKKRVQAAVITVARAESLPAVENYIAQGLSVDSIRTAIARDSVKYVYVRKGFYQEGDNQNVDKTEWKIGTINRIPSTVDQSTVIVEILDVRDPEPKTLREAKGLVTSDYQTELEGKWIDALHQRYPVVLNDKVLNKIRKSYQ